MLSHSSHTPAKTYPRPVNILYISNCLTNMSYNACCCYTTMNMPLSSATPPQILLKPPGRYKNPADIPHKKSCFEHLPRFLHHGEWNNFTSLYISPLFPSHTNIKKFLFRLPPNFPSSWREQKASPVDIHLYPHQSVMTKNLLLFWTPLTFASSRQGKIASPVDIHYYTLINLSWPQKKFCFHHLSPFLHHSRGK
jgi:hypothetical protein